MMNSFVEPWLLKTIHLLHSSHPDAPEQLKALHDRSLEPDGESYIQKITLSDVMKEHSNANANAAAASGATISRSNSVSRSMNAGMKIAPVEFSSDQSNDSVPEKKRPKLALVNIFDNVSGTAVSNATPVTSSASVGAGHKSQTNVSTVLGSSKSKRSSGSTLNFPSNSETLIVEDLVGDLNCCVCHTMTIDRSDNSLIECSQCSKLYHQLCHEPPIIKPKSSNSWLCAECNSKETRK